MSQKFKNILTGEVFDAESVMAMIESGHIDGLDPHNYRTTCCESEVFTKIKSTKAREHFASIHKEDCPFKIKEYYIDSEGNEKYLTLSKLPSVLNLNFFSNYDDDYKKEGNGTQGDSSNRSSKESDAVPRALYILEKVVGSSRSIDIRLGDETISSHEVIDCRGISLKELTEECNDRYIFAEVKELWYSLESDDRKATMSIVINAGDGSLRISLSDDIKSNTRPNHFNIEGQKPGKKYVFFKLRKYEKGAYSKYSSLRVATIKNGYGDSSKKIYKILGATIYSK